MAVPAVSMGGTWSGPGFIYGSVLFAGLVQLISKCLDRTISETAINA